jgi:hypothetical protein
MHMHKSMVSTREHDRVLVSLVSARYLSTRVPLVRTEYYVVACGDWHLGPSPSHHLHRLYHYDVCTTSDSTSTTPPTTSHQAETITLH